MKRQSILIFMLYSLSCLFADGQVSDLFTHQRINIFDKKHLPNSIGKEHKDSIVNNRIWRVDQPRLYAYMPGQEERTSTAVIVIPGGGYIKQAYETAGVSIAKWLNTFGVTAFVLLHRMPNQPDIKDAYMAPIIDAQRAIKWVRAHAEELKIDPSRIGVMGCSAGGHLSACVSVLKKDFSCCRDSLDTICPRPNFAILISPAILYKSKDRQVQELYKRFSIKDSIDSTTPPMLMIHASDDRTVSSIGSIELYENLWKAGVKRSSIHIFPFGAHGISLRHQPGSTAYWPFLAEEWMRETDVLTK